MVLSYIFNQEAYEHLTNRYRQASRCPASGNQVVQAPSSDKPVDMMFTIYQLAHLIICKLPKIVERLSSDKQNNFIVVVYDLLAMFMSDPQIDKVDAKQLIKEIAASIRKISEDRFTIRHYEKH